MTRTQRKVWSNGVLECWSNAKMRANFALTLLHYSVTPSLQFCLFKVLNLLADLLQLGLAGNRPLRDGGIISIGSQRVQFTKNFLGDKFKRSSHRLVFAKVMGKLREMTLQPRQFFRDIGLIGEDGDFLEQSIITLVHWDTGLLDSLEQGCAITFHHVRMQPADFLQVF